jgi:Mannitol dehydrogenase Rossmann domain
LPADPQPLNARTLKHWAGRVPVPAYDWALVTPGVVHVGVGGFHRAHQAMYHDQLMNQGAALDWGICGVGVLGCAFGDHWWHLRRMSGWLILRGSHPGRRERHARAGQGTASVC